MSTEIKVIEADVENVLNDLKNSIHSMETSFSTTIQGKCKLEMVDKCNQLNDAFTNVLEMYQTLLLNSEEKTRKSVDVLKETEENIATEIQSLK